MLVIFQKDKDLVRLLVLLGMIMLSTIAISAWLYVPAVKSLHLSQQTLSTVKKELMLLKSAKKQHEYIQSNKAVIAEIHNQLTADFKSAEFSSLISKSAVANELIIRSESYDQDKDEKLYSVQLEFLGQYSGVRGLLNDLINFPNLVIVDKVSIRKKESESVSARINLTIAVMREIDAIQ